MFTSFLLTVLLCFFHLFSLVTDHLIHSINSTGFSSCRRFFLSCLVPYNIDWSSTFSYSLSFFPPLLYHPPPLFFLHSLLSGKHKHRWSSQLLGEAHHCQWERHAPVRSPRHHHASIRKGQRWDMLLMLQIPVGPGSWILITHSVQFVCEEENKEELLLALFEVDGVGANSFPVFKLGWVGCGVWVDREAAGSGNGWIWAEAEREMGAAVCSCQRQGHPLGDFRPRHCHFGYHGDGVNEHMHRKVVANHRISVLEVCGSNHYIEAMVAAPLSLFLLSSLFFSSALIFLLCLFVIPNPYLTALLVCHVFHASFTSKQRKQVKNFFSPTLSQAIPSQC